MRRLGETDRVDLQERLHHAGLRSTGARIKVLQVLERAGHPLSHAEVCDHLTGEPFDKATIYRNLVDMTHAGLLERLDRGDHIWRFQQRSTTDHAEDHPHFVCTRCGQKLCLPTSTVELRPAARSAVPRDRRTMAVQLQGLCDACEERQG